MSYSKVGNNGLSDNAVTTAHIQNNAITTPKIADGAVTSIKIAIDADISANNNKITNLAAPININDAVTKSYADAVIQGLDTKQSVRLSTSSNIALTGIQTIDGILGITGDRILLRGQATASENGIYIMAAGAWARSNDANSNTKVTSQLYTFVEEGTVFANIGYTLTTPDPIVLDTTALSFAQFSSAGQVTAGLALTKTGSQLDVNVDNSTIEIISNNLQVKNSSISNIKLSTDAVSTLKILNSAVTSAKIANAAIDKTKIAADIAGLGLSQAIAGELDVNVDNSSLQIVTDTLQVKPLGITDAMLTGSISDAKLATQYIQATQVDNTSVEFAGSTLNVKSAGITNVHAASSIITGQVETTANSDLDSILIYDASLTSLRKMTRANFINGIVTGSAGDIQETLFNAANNVTIAANVTGLSHSNVTVRSFKAIVSVEIVATTNLYEVFEIVGIQKNGIWDISYSSVGDISGVNFTINASGQILYTSSNIIGFTSSKFKFRSTTTTV